MRLDNNINKADYPMVIILGEKKPIQGLIKAVSQSFDSIRLIDSYSEIRRPHVWVKPELVILTDYFPGGLNRHVLEFIKVMLDPDKIICLGRFITPGNEVELRSSGLTFMGSYDEFLKDAENIMRPNGITHRALKDHTVQAM